MPIKRISLIACVLLGGAGCEDTAIGISDVDSGRRSIDQATLIDLSVPRDMQMPVQDFIDQARDDISLPGDMTAPVDEAQVQPVDFAVGQIHDFAVIGDLATQVDFRVVPDLSVKADLTVIPSCNDGLQNAAETDVDCGGGTCAKCGGNRRCKAAADCLGNSCTAGICDTMMSFSAPITTGVAGSPAALASDDFNGDRLLDLVVVNASNDFAGVLLGKGDGSFETVKLSGAGTRPVAVTAGDLTGDGISDVAVANANGVALLIGKGDGSLAAPSAWAAGPNPTSIRLGDLNSDGRLDIIMASRGNIGGDPGNVAILLSSVKGIQPPVVKAAGSYPTAVAIGDFNRDGKQDIAATNLLWMGGVVVMLGDGTGAFAGNPPFFAARGNPYSVASGDFNDDGILDLAVPNSGTDDLALLIGKGNGTFADPLLTACDKTPIALAVADFNLDHKLDIAVVNSLGQPNHVTIMLGDGKGNFPTTMTLTAGSGSGAIVSADFNHDGTQDIAVTDSVNNSVTVLLNKTF